MKNSYKSIRKTLRPKIDTLVKDKQISKEEMQMENQHMIKYPASLVFNKMQIEKQRDIISSIKLTKILK